MKPLLALKASAGSGKTTRLVGRYLELLENGANPNEILCLTFTNKAAGEMKERIILALEKSNLAKLKALQSQINDAPILTFDAFFNRILRSFCFYAGVPMDYEIVSNAFEPEAFFAELDELDRWRVAKFLKEYNVSVDALMKNFGDFFELPNLLQTKKVKFNEERVLGFARTIQNEVLSFEGASESAKKSVEFKNVFELLESGKTWLTKDELNEYSFFKKVIFSSGAKQSFIELKSELKEWFEAREARFLNQIGAWFSAYESARTKRFRVSGECAHSDVTRGAWKLLNGALTNEFLYFRLDGRITHVLIDEFQDTNRLQYDILEPIIAEIISGEGRRGGRTFFYVGDPKQSIYRFRGGVSALFSELSNSIEAMEVEELDKGYRLFSENMRFVNEKFAPQFSEFAPQKVGDEQKQNGGYVEVCESEEIVKEVAGKVKFLLDSGVAPSQIAVLCFKNDECEDVAEALAENNVAVLREATTKLVNQKEARAIIEWLKFCVFDSKLNRLNALKLFGLDFLQNEERDKFSLNSSPTEAIFTVMRKFKAFSPSSFALLERGAKYESLQEFINKIQNDDIAFNSEGACGVRVLTVHKSKGLEFEFVILADRVGQARNYGGATFMEYEGAKPSKLWRKDKLREHFDKEYLAAKEGAKIDSENDDRNALYVACTRGKRGLIIVKKPQKSSFDALNLKPFIAGEITPINDGQAEISEVKIKDIKWINLGRQEVIKSAELDKKAITLGVATHSAMEFWSDNEVEIKALLGLKTSDLAIISEAFELAKTMQKYLVDIVRDKKVYKEVGFIIGGKIGRIDLLALSDNEAVIIDYKSGSSGDKTYKAQLGFYKKAVYAILGIDAKAIILRPSGY